jgi:hypothetical protein
VDQANPDLQIIHRGRIKTMTTRVRQFEAANCPSLQ